MKMIPATNTIAPLLRMRELAVRNLSSRCDRLRDGSSHRGHSASRASQWGHVSRVFTTAEPHAGHLRVCRIGGKLGSTHTMRHAGKLAKPLKLFTIGTNNAL